jgi:hypothetical protein
MGESDMSRKNPREPRHIAGVFLPTDYGRRLLPRVTGLLAAASALKEEMAASGMSEDAIQNGERMAEFLGNSPAGQTLIDGGRVLSDVQLRDSSGTQLEFTTIAFVDIEELKSVAVKLGCALEDEARTWVPPRAPQFIVSATLIRRATVPLMMRVRHT